MSAMKEPPAVHGADTRQRQWRQWWWALAAAAVLVAVLGTVAVRAVDGDSGQGRTAAAPTSSAAPTSAAPSSGTPATSEPAPAPTGPAPTGPAPTGPAPVEPVPADPAPVGGLPVALPAVALDQPVELAGVTGSLVSVRSVDGQATGPGDVAGPAVMVTVRLVNGTADELSLDAVSVNLFSGAGRMPASPVNDPRRAPFTGALAGGETAEGVYVFSVPSDDRDRVDVEIGYRPGESIVVFSGSVR